jgi:hypothetical protein
VLVTDKHPGVSHVLVTDKENGVVDAFARIATVHGLPAFEGSNGMEGIAVT